MKTAHFYIDSTIGDLSEEMISSKHVSNFIKQNQSADELVIHINSPGGDVVEGFAIYDLLTNSGKKITTRVEGQAYSIASVIMLAGSVRQITENSRVGIHNPLLNSAGVEGMEADEIIKVGQEVKQIENKAADFYAKKTGLDISVVSEMMKEDTAMDANKALELKFVTEIVTPVKALAFFNNKKQNQNNTVMTEVKNEVKTLGQKLDAFIASFKKEKNIQANVGQDLKITTADNIELTVEDSEGIGKPTITAAVKDKDGKNVPSTTFKMPDGTEITTDAASKISAIKEPEIVQDVDLKAENESLKQEVAAMKVEQAAVAKKVEWVMQNVSSTFTPPASKTEFPPLKITEIDIAAEAKARKETYKKQPSKQLAVN